MRSLLLALALVAAAAAQPIRLDPENPHYFRFEGKPTVLITSGEHYGAVLNHAFNYVRYLDTLHADHLNLTRTFAGSYREVYGDFSIANNTLAPAPDQYVAPWAQTNGKFDLTRWNEAYFTRLKDFLTQASRRGVVVELVLFCPFYRDSMWEVNPMNAANNVNGIGKVERTDVFTLKDAALTKVQDALVRKIVTELRGFDNLYYEICNEPYFGGVTPEWQAHIARLIADVESGSARKHLIAQNWANGSKTIDNPNPLVSLFNFHYSRPPDSVAMNWKLGARHRQQRDGLRRSCRRHLSHSGLGFPDGWRSALQQPRLFVYGGARRRLRGGFRNDARRRQRRHCGASYDTCASFSIGSRSGGCSPPPQAPCAARREPASGRWWSRKNHAV